LAFATIGGFCERTVFVQRKGSWIRKASGRIFTSRIYWLNRIEPAKCLLKWWREDGRERGMGISATGKSARGFANCGTAPPLVALLF
jgi:hypothetical protein